MHKISDRHKLFVERYCQHFNGARAAREAGYAESHDAQQASRLLGDPDISEMVEERIQELKSGANIPISDALKRALIQKFGSVEAAVSVIEKVAFSVLDGGDLSSIKREGISEDRRYEVLYKAGFKCQACGATPEANNDVELQVDHIVPHSAGGSNDEGNLQALCARCNSSKDNNYAYDHNRDIDLLDDTDTAQ